MNSRRELELLVEREGKIVYAPPEWLGELPEDAETVRRATEYLVLTPDICVPLQRVGEARMVGLTVLTRGHISDLRRARKNARKQQKRAARRASRSHESWLGERKPRWN